MEEEYKEIGPFEIKVLKKFYNIKTNKLIITKERIEHINKRHNNDYNLYGKYMTLIIKEPDYILLDSKNNNTVLYLKKIEELNLQMVIKLQTESKLNKANTVITFWHMRDRSYKQIIRNNIKIFENLDKKE